MATPKRPNRPRDVNQLAHAVFLESIGEKPKVLPENETPSDPAKAEAIKRSRKGGIKGGPLRAAKLSEERRKEIAQKAARARWAKKPEDS